MSTSLTEFRNADVELVINTQTGECFASQRGLARMVDKNESVIRAWVTAQVVPTLEAEILTAAGLRSAQLLDERMRLFH
jgi:hypothetical protein